MKVKARKIPKEEYKNNKTKILKETIEALKKQNIELKIQLEEYESGIENLYKEIIDLKYNANKYTTSDSEYTTSFGKSNNDKTLFINFDNI